MTPRPAAAALAFAAAAITVWFAYGARGVAPVMAWAAARLVEGGMGPYVYDDQRTIAAAGDILSPSPPTMPLIAVPLVPLSPDAAALVWTVANVIALGLATWLILGRLRRLAAAPLGVAIAVAGFALSAPFAVNAARGQAYVWVLLLFALVFAASPAAASGDPARQHTSRGWTERRGWVAAVGLTGAFALKVAGWPLWLVLTVRREWSPLVRGALLVAIGLVVTLPFIGVETWVHYWTVVVPGWTARPEAGVTAFQTVAGFFQHLFRREPRWNPEPLADLPAAAASLTVACAAALLIATLVAARRVSRDEAVGAGVLLVPLLSPVAEQYHYLPALIPLAVAADQWLDPARGRGRIRLVILALATFLLLWPLPFLSPALANGPISILAYPRLAGALLLWGVMVAGAFRPVRVLGDRRDLQLA